ncbi:uncharacterized protein B0H64DRAFT_403408 [Chaetomium fimeti]|uniref:Uncharacterized protein n=1 Tax=Chaetomium fimeti TaxID=1854472 RepID=A0AAE0HAN6_9PEZI|nr:hypothetical protein B0H64DRAFT_403408 [Chaetomium fimeti]
MTPFRVQPDPKAHHFLNTLTCMRLCVDNAKYLPPEESWPLDHFFKIAPLIMSAATSVEASLFAEQFETLLAELGSDESLLESSPYVRVFFMITTINVGLLRKLHANDSAGRWRDFAKRARRLCESASLSPLFHNMVAGCLVALTSDFQGGLEPLTEFLPYLIQVAETPRPNLGQDDRFSDKISRGLSQSTEEARIARQRITAAPAVLSQPPDPAIVRHVRDLARHLETKPLRDGVERLGDHQPEHEAHGKAESDIVMDFLARCWEQPGDGARLSAQLFLPRSMTAALRASGPADIMKRLDSHLGQLNAAETAMNRADWDSSQTLHYTLFRSHFKNGDIRQASEHLRQLIVAMGGKPERRELVEHFERCLRLIELHDICLGISAADTDTLEETSNVGPALQEMERLAQDFPDPDLREMLLQSVASARAVAQLKPSSHPDADGWKDIRNDLQKLNVSVTTKEDMKGVLHNSSTARKSFQTLKERLDEGKTREALASLDELEKLCKKEPTAMFIVAGGQATLDWFRAEMQKELKAEEDREHAVRALADAELQQQLKDAEGRERAVREAREQLAAQQQRLREQRLREQMMEGLGTVIVVAGSVLLSFVVDWIWPL